MNVYQWKQCVLFMWVTFKLHLVCVHSCARLLQANSCSLGVPKRFSSRLPLCCFCCFVFLFFPLYCTLCDIAGCTVLETFYQPIENQQGVCYCWSVVFGIQRSEADSLMILEPIYGSLMDFRLILGICTHISCTCKHQPRHLVRAHFLNRNLMLSVSRKSKLLLHYRIKVADQMKVSWVALRRLCGCFKSFSWHHQLLMMMPPPHTHTQMFHSSCFFILCRVEQNMYI